MSEVSKWEEFRLATEEYQRKRIERLRIAEHLPPPWEQFPQMARGAIGWRMGVGEDNLADWFLWMRSLLPRQLEAYQARHPEPDSWHGTYASLAQTNCQEWDRNSYWDLELERQRQIIGSQIEIGRAHE